MADLMLLMMTAMTMNMRMATTSDGVCDMMDVLVTDVLSQWKAFDAIAVHFSQRVYSAQ